MWTIWTLRTLFHRVLCYTAAIFPFKQRPTLALLAKRDGFGHLGLCLLSSEELRIAVQSVQWLDDLPWFQDG